MPFDGHCVDRLPTKSKPAKAPTTRSMSDAHKAALATGRNEGRAVRNYLEALRANKPKRGRKRTPDGVNKRLAAIDAQLAEADPINELQLVQERRDLEVELESLDGGVDMAALEAGFIKVAQTYSARQGISYAA